MPEIFRPLASAPSPRQVTEGRFIREGGSPSTGLPHGRQRPDVLLLPTPPSHTLHSMSHIPSLVRATWRGAGLLAAFLLAAPVMAQNTLPLEGGQTMQRGQRYLSPAGSYLIFQTDGNLVVYTASGGFVWGLNETGADFGRAARVVMQEDGNLAVYAADGGYIWSALSADPSPGSIAYISPSGALQVLSTDRGVRWSSDGTLASPQASAPQAAMQTGRWRVHEGTPARHNFGRTIANGDNEGFLSGSDVSDVPRSNEAGWSNASTDLSLSWSGPGGTPCRSQANYTYFETFVMPEPGMRYEVEFMSVDDAARVAVNAGTGWINFPDLVGLRETKTVVITDGLFPDELNRVVITLADVCGSGNGIRAVLRSVPQALSEDGNPNAYRGGNDDGETMTIGGTVVLTGSIQVTLEWDTRLADLDLFVTDPSGATVGYNNQNVASGGLLDVDARAGCQETPSTVENIVWQGTPPSGRYQVMVDHYQQCSGQGPVAFTATLRRGGQVVETWRGTVGAEEDQTYSFTSN